MADVRLIPCLSDNYAVLVHKDGETILIDAPEAGPIKAALEETGWTLTSVLVTHHHSDHVQAIGAVKGSATVIGPEGEADRIKGLDRTVADGEEFKLGPVRIRAISTPGHTSGPLCYYLPEERIAFTADTLFAMGCGRLFEGDAATMWRSLQTLRAALPDDTDIYCGHEYTLTNARYAHETLPDDVAIAERLEVVREARERKEPTVPTTMAAEKATNPFLRADDPTVAAALGMEGVEPAEVFARLRKGRDGFS
ncbi:hydroxyacylglutathione hydrolase [Acuticoccus sediminis]|uniref:hydroxyacylglutathione hydrolase n=1 Tax=Acuticoccus sediminis TaxID=2184697 RepID=UPI001CFE9F8B|nr:hydroxyacylglutathione hydrolase [Acuticoccus sediminis]